MHNDGSLIKIIVATPMNRPLSPKRDNLATQVARDLAIRVDSGDLKPGDRLPPERELMEIYGVSRTVVREAISSLRSSGRVATHQGRGAFVKTSPATVGISIDVADLSTARDVLYIMDVRIGLESEAAALAAKNRSEEDLKTIVQALEELNKAHGTQPRYDADFHLAIARSTHNHYFADLLGDLAHLLIPPLRLKLAHTSDAERENYLNRINQEHAQIVKAISQSDSEGARAAMRVHLVNGRDRLHEAFVAESKTPASTKSE